MAYSTCAKLLAMIPNLTDNSASIDNMGANVFPGSAALISFLSSGCSIINAKVRSMGYAPPITSSAEIYDYLGQLEALYGAWQAEAARSSPRTAQGERTRADQFKRAFEDGLKQLESMDLSRMGVGLDSTTDWYIGGISYDEKSTVESDADRIPTRFKRGQFEARGVRSDQSAS